MRYLIPAAIVFSILASGCCGAANPTAQTADVAPSRARSVARSEATHDGCSLKIGAECGGKVVFGTAFQFPNPIDLLRGLWTVKTGTPAPFRQPATPDCAPVAPSSAASYYVDHEGRMLVPAAGQ